MITRFLNQIRSNCFSWIIPAVIVLLVLSIVMGTTVISSKAAGIFTVKPMTWNVVGLDSNDVNVGPNNFPVGARVCNTGTTENNVDATFVWDDGLDPYTGNAYINLRSSSLSTITIPSLANGACHDLYFEVSITRNSGAYDKTRRYHITVTPTTGSPVSTPRPREIYVERLISQSRNSTTDVFLNGGSIPNGGSMNLVVGQTYTITLVGATATQGYEQIESFINFPNTIFQILSVASTYNAVSGGGVTPIPKLYNDACSWENDPDSPSYRSCLVVGKAGGSVTNTYVVKIIAGGGTSQALSNLIYDFSGSSYHYNSDFGAAFRIVNIIDPSLVTIVKSFSPNPTNAGGSSTLTITLHNPNTATINGATFTDPFPTSPGAMVVGNPTGGATTGCGTPAFAPVAGAGSISFSNGSIGPMSDCIIKVNVNVPVTGTYNNTTSTLKISDGLNIIDTGTTASASLTVNTTPPPPPPTCGWTMAQWTFAGFTANPPPQPGPSTQASDVITASISLGNGLNDETDTTAAGGNPQPGLLSYGYQKVGPINPATSAYIQFAIDTRNYKQINVQFDANRKSNGPTSDYVFYSTDGVNFVQKASFNSTTSWATYGPYDFTSQTSITGTTYFRIYGYGANATTKGNDLTFDNVTITGCKVPVPPTISKTFVTDPVAVNGISTLRFTITNTNTIPLSGVAFTDTLPTGLQVAGAPNENTNCNGTPTWKPAAGNTTLTFGTPNGATLPASSSCTVQVDIVATTPGPHQNVSGFVTSTQSGPNTGPSGFATASLTAISPPGIAKSFAPKPILVGNTSMLTFTIVNPNQNNALTSVAFADTYPANLVNANLTTYPITNTCGGAVTAATGGNSISLSGGSINPGGSCMVKVTVTSSAANTYVNTSGNISAAITGDGNTATDTLVVQQVHPGVSILKQVGPSIAGTWTTFLALNSLPSDVYYHFTIENTGDVPLNPVTLTDPKLTSLISGCSWSNPIAPLPVAVVGNNNHISSCTVGATTVSSAGWYTNTATVHGWYGSTEVTDQSTATAATTGLTIVKSVTESSFAGEGDVLHYSYLVTNSGSAPLAGPVTISDDKSTDESCPNVNTVGDLDNFLDPGESITCTATYTVQAADDAAAYVTNAAYATAGGVNSNTDTKTVSRAPLDFGDLPSTYHDTMLSDHGPRHTIGDLWLGAATPPTAELDGQESLAASLDTDDGVSRVSGELWTPGVAVHLDVQIHGTGGYLVGWFDWDGNGVFDPGDMVNFGVVADGANQLTLTVPASTYQTGQPVYTRFRLYSGDPGSPQPTGLALNGEVEDYQWLFKPTAVTLTALQARPASHLRSLLPGAAVLLCGLAFLLLYRRKPVRGILPHSD